MKKVYILGIAFLATTFLAWCGKQADANADGHLTSFAQCLTQKWLKMYGTDRCPHCQKMKAMFGSAFSGINFINCDQQQVQCDAAGVRGYPTRSFNGTKYEGEQSLEQLASITSCQLPSETGSTSIVIDTGVTTK